MIYKFRAECLYDVIRFMAEVEPKSYTVYPDLHRPDVTIEVDCIMQLDQLVEIANNLVDCHVIAQTLLPKSMYTGVRENNDRFLNYKFALKTDGLGGTLNVKALSLQSAFLKVTKQERCPDSAIELLEVSY